MGDKEGLGVASDIVEDTIGVGKVMEALSEAAKEIHGLAALALSCCDTLFVIHSVGMLRTLHELVIIAQKRIA
ncbi:hypothetical protein K1719_032126 [Acacia pycnantha]|nr:hypothetical protein K1719_032126 [Acacia pycnantha]